jgi:hypothetical protein
MGSACCYRCPYVYTEKPQTRTTAQTMIHPIRYADFDYNEEMAAGVGYVMSFKRSLRASQCLW